MFGQVRTRLLLAVLGLSTCQSAARAEDFVLATNGQATAAIVVAAGGGTNGGRYAATMLADFLGRLSGARFAVAAKPIPGYRTILVGAPYAPSKSEELCIRVKDAETLEVTGDGPRGTMHAVSELLERFGVVFCAHDYDFVPERASLSLPADFAFTDAPAFVWRDSWTELQRHHADFMLKLRLTPAPKSRESTLFGIHSRPNIDQTVCTRYVPRKKFFADHPDWYAWVAATKTRNPHWVCVSNEAMYEELFREIDSELAADSSIREISVGVDDGASFCECANCLALLDAARDPDGAEVPALQYVILANRVGEHFEKKYPDVRFNLLAYGDKMPSNPSVRFRANVGAGVAELWRNHGLAADCNERSAACLGNVARMSTPGNGPYIWDYLANFGDYTIPYPNHFIFAQTAQYYRRMGVKGVISQLAFPLIAEMGEMKMWLYAKLLWNPDADINALIDTYVNAAYGKGAKFVREYIDRLEHARLRQRWTWYGCYVLDTTHYLTDEDCLRMVRAMESAVNATRGDEGRNRLARRAQIAALNLALTRYDDILAAAERLGVKVKPFADCLYDWTVACESERLAGHDMEIGEGAMFQWVRDRRYRPQLTNRVHSATTWPPRTDDIVHVAADRLTGGRRMTRGRDADVTDYARFYVSLRGERENYWMNPDFAEIGWTLPAEKAGAWYVFVTVRNATTVEDDPAAFYAGIYQPFYMNGVKVKPIQEVVNRAIPSRKGETGWRTLCLGKRILYPESRIWVMPGILHQSDFTDVKEIFLVSPDLFERGESATRKGAVRVISADRFDRTTAGLRLETDRFDRDRFAHLDAAAAELAYTVKAADAGRWHVFLDVRSWASRALDPEVAVATVGRGGFAPVARTVITGSRGDEAWQVVSLGTVDLVEGMKISLVPRQAGDDLPRATDLRRIILVAPSAIEGARP